MSSASSERVVPVWLVLATCAGAMAEVGIVALGTHAPDPAQIPFTAPFPAKPEREIEVHAPPDASPAELVDFWTQQLEVVRRRIRRTSDAIQSLGAVGNELSSGAYPAEGAEHLEARRRALDEALARHRADRERIEGLLEELRERARASDGANGSGG